jgi:hypothetical protein
MVKRYLLLAVATIICLAAFGSIYILVFGRFNETEVRVMGTTLSLAVFSLTGLCCALWLEKKQLLPLAYAGIIVSALTWLLSILLIWEVIKYSSKSIEPLSKADATGLVLSVALAYSSLMLLLRSHTTLVDNIIYFSLGCISIIAIMLIGWIIFEWHVRDQYWRALGVFAILASLGTLLAPIARKLQVASKSNT